jgi:exopolysaccharide biosynthesis protein
MLLRAAAPLLALAASALAQQPVVVPWPTPSATPLTTTMGYGTVNSTGTRFNWYASVLDDLSRFTVALPDGGCAVRSTTTATANLRGCEVAVNFGYFQFSPKPTYCLGEIVINGTIEQWADDGAPMLSMTANRTTLIGALAQGDVAARHVTFASAGFGIIVLDGKVHEAGVARASAAVRALRPTAEEVAPRTVAGVDAQGRLVLAAIDGVEALNLGTTMNETAEIFAGGAAGFPFTLQHAINFDGGGSTTFSKSSPFWPFPARVYNRPTDTDVGDVTERNVTSIACILPTSA